MKEIESIIGDFSFFEIPKEYLFLLKYFKSPAQADFLKYYMFFGEWKNFCNHTGHKRPKPILCRWANKYNKLIDLKKKVKSDFTEENMKLLQKIESGNFKLTDLK